MTDFATEEFISKNIRIRPQSGVTHGDERSEMMPHRTATSGFDANQDEDERLHRDALYMMDNQRKEAKERKAAFEKKRE